MHGRPLGLRTEGLEGIARELVERLAFRLATPIDC
jgi:hypothetical protein